MSAEIRTGILALANATTLTIATGVVTATQGYHIIAAETGVTDDLDTISLSSDLNLSTYRPVLVIVADAGDTITVKHGTGNIVLNGAADFSLTSSKALSLFYDGTNWHDMGAGGGSGAPTTATYITQTADATLSAEQALSSLATGAMVVTTGTGVVTSLKHNLSATAAPTTTDDSGAGYSVGSLWVDTTNDKSYICVDATATAAVWNDLTAGGTPDASVVTYTPTTAADWDGGTDPGNADDALDQLAAARTAIAILRDEKASGTNGGSSSAATWNARDLNTEVYDNKNIVTIAANQFTPIAGEYKLYAKATVGLSGGNRLRLYNVTGAASVREGMNNSATVAGSDRNTNTLNAIFTANGTDAYRIDHYTASALASTGLGIAISTGANEVYMEIILEKIG